MTARGNRARLFCTLAVAGGLAVAATTARADDWEAYQHDAQHTGRAGIGPVPSSLKLSWSAPTGYTSPLIVGNAVLGLSTSGGSAAPTQVASFDLATGAMNWNAPVPASLASAEAYFAGNVAFVGSASGGKGEFLYVLNAATGATRYTVPLPYGGNEVPYLTVATDTTTASPVAYVNTGNNFTAVRLGATSGTVLYAPYLGGSESVPAVMGNYAILATPEQYYAVNRTTGAINHFYNGGGDGGGGDAPVVDLAHNRFFVTELHGSTHNLTAYSLNPTTGAIAQLWTDTGVGVGTAGDAALAADGTLYSADTSTLVQIDPATGAILRSVAGAFGNDNAPLLSNGYAWEFGGGGGGRPLAGDTVAYALSDLSVAAAIPVTRGDGGEPFAGIGPLDDTHLIVAFGAGYNAYGFQVYSGAAAPEPASAAVIGVVATGLWIGRRPSCRRGH